MDQAILTSGPESRGGECGYRVVSRSRFPRFLPTLDCAFETGTHLVPMQANKGQKLKSLPKARHLANIARRSKRFVGGAHPMAGKKNSAA